MEISQRCLDAPVEGGVRVDHVLQVLDGYAAMDRHRQRGEHLAPNWSGRRCPDQQAILFINDAGGFWHNKGATRKYPIAFGYTEGSWFCMESTKRDDGKLLWRLAQGEPYLRTTFKGTTAELNKVLVDHFAGKGKLPEPVKAEPGFGPEYQPKK